MSKNKKNIYAKRAKRKAISGLGSAPDAKLPAKGHLKTALAFTGKDILLGGIGGALGGVVMGRGAFLVGIGVTGLGYYFGSPTATMTGVGMMASGGYQSMSGLHGVEQSGIEGIKDRFKNYTQNLKRQLFLDKLVKKKAATDEGETNGVDYYHHSGDEVSGLDFTEANRLQEQISESARQFEAQHQMSGLEGVDGVDGIEDRLL